MKPRSGSQGLEPLALGIAEWHAQISPAGDCAVFFRDSAFEDDVAKTNLVAIGAALVWERPKSVDKGGLDGACA